MNLLRVVGNPRAEISLAAVMRSPLGGISDEALLRLKMTGNLGSALRKIEHIDASFDESDRRKLRRFREQMLRWREERELVGFDRLLMRVIDETGYASEPGSPASANVEQFLTLAFEAAPRLTLAEFVEELQLMRESDAPDADPPPHHAGHA